MSDTKRTLKINPDLFKLNGKEKKKKRNKTFSSSNVYKKVYLLLLCFLLDFVSWVFNFKIKFYAF